MSDMGVKLRSWFGHAVPRSHASRQNGHGQNMKVIGQKKDTNHLYLFPCILIVPRSRRLLFRGCSTPAHMSYTKGFLRLPHTILPCVAM